MSWLERKCLLCKESLTKGVRGSLCEGCGKESAKHFTNKNEVVMDKVVIGIDTGAKGAVACLSDDGKAQWVADMPSLKDRKGKDIVDGSGLCEIIADAMVYHDVLVVIEDVNAMPKQGVTSSFNFGVSKGVILGVVQAIGVPYELVHPTVWKKKLGFAGHDKDYVRTSAIQKWPELHGELKLKKHIDRADALMIGLWKCQNS